MERRDARDDVISIDIDLHRVEIYIPCMNNRGDPGGLDYCNYKTLYLSYSYSILAILIFPLEPFVFSIRDIIPSILAGVSTTVPSFAKGHCENSSSVIKPHTISMGVS